MSDRFIARLAGVVKSYEGGRITAVDDVDLAIEPGSITAIVGPSGSGKSTLLAIMGGLERPDRGSVWISGKSLWKRTDMADVRALQIGFVFQLYNLVPVLSAAENVELAMIGRVARAQERRARSTQLLERLDMGDRRQTQARFLSGGERQRVALARALANDPALILADEPTGALDQRSGRLLLEEFQRLQREEGKTLVIVTHAPEVAAIATRTCTLIDGRLEVSKPTAGPSGNVFPVE